MTHKVCAAHSSRCFCVIILVGMYVPVGALDDPIMSLFGGGGGDHYQERAKGRIKISPYPYHSHKSLYGFFMRTNARRKKGPWWSCSLPRKWINNTGQEDRPNDDESTATERESSLPDCLPCLNFKRANPKIKKKTMVDHWEWESSKINDFGAWWQGAGRRKKKVTTHSCDTRVGRESIIIRMRGDGSMDRWVHVASLTVGQKTKDDLCDMTHTLLYVSWHADHTMYRVCLWFLKGGWAYRHGHNGSTRPWTVGLSNFWVGAYSCHDIDTGNWCDVSRNDSRRLTIAGDHCLDHGNSADRRPTARTVMPPIEHSATWFLQARDTLVLHLLLLLLFSLWICKFFAVSHINKIQVNKDDNDTWEIDANGTLISMRVCEKWVTSTKVKPELAES